MPNEASSKPPNAINDPLLSAILALAHHPLTKHRSKRYPHFAEPSLAYPPADLTSLDHHPAPMGPAYWRVAKHSPGASHRCNVRYIDSHSTRGAAEVLDCFSAFLHTGRAMLGLWREKRSACREAHLILLRFGSQSVSDHHHH